MSVIHTYCSAFATSVFFVRHSQTPDTPVQVKSHRVDEPKGPDEGQGRRREVILVNQRPATKGTPLCLTFLHGSEALREALPWAGSTLFAKWF